MIDKIIEALHEATDLPVKPMITKKIENQIVYNHYPLSDNGAKSIQRLELRLITKTYEEAESYRKLIIQALVPTADNVIIDGITDCELNGGGTLYEGETQTYHTMLFFNYIHRSENK